MSDQRDTIRESRPTPRLRGFWRRWQFWSLLTIVALTGSGIACDRCLNADPTFALPAPAPLPVPNGYDDFRRAVALHREREYDKRTGKPKPLTPAQVDALFRDNTAAIRALHVGFMHEYRLPPVRPPDFPGTSDYTDADGFRSLARTLAFESEERARRGDVEGALNLALDGVEMGAILPRGGGAWDWRIGNVCEAVAGRNLWSLAPRLDAEQAAHAVRRLEDAQARRSTFVDALREDEWRGVSARIGFLHQANLETLRLLDAVGVSQRPAKTTESTEASDSREADETLPPVGTQERGAAWARVATLSKQQIVDGYADWMQAQIARANVPYNAAHSPLPALDEFNEIMKTGYRQTRFHGTYDQADESLLTTTLALRAYRLRTGAYPPALSALVQAGILRRVPVDPFAPDAETPLRYRPLVSGAYQLYSVGPDGVDDGGRVVDFSKPLPDGMVFKNRVIVSTDTGDMLPRWSPSTRP